MKANRVHTSIWSRWLSCVAFMLAALAGSAWAGPVQLWVQPSGNTFATAYALQNESRDYFGRAECNACGALEYKWEFSDGTSVAFAVVGNNRFIGHAGKTFATFGTHWARLTVRESANTANTASAQIDLQVIASASDNLNRQKNSAIDRGLRNLYQNELDAGNGSSYWNSSGYSVGETGMSLIAFENHGHNLQAPDNDIYKKSVQRGVQWLLNNATKPDINDQRCIGNPDTNGNGKGVLVGNAHHIYEPSIALLALVNSADKAFAQGYVASTTSAVNGMTLFDIAVDATDWLAWAQSDGGSGGGGASVSCTSPGGSIDAYYSGPDVTNIRGYFYTGNASLIGGMGGTFSIDWGDASASGTYVDSQVYNYGTYGYPEINYNNYVTLSHTYAVSGTYPVTFTYQGGTDSSITTALCSVNVPIVVGSGVAACGAADAQQGAGGWSYSPNEARGDNSLTQWAVLGISEAKTRWGIDVNPAVITQLGHWLDWSQCSNGTFGYDAPGSWCNYQKVGAGLIMLKYVGKPLGDAAVQSALNYASANWSTSGSEYNLSNLYSMYGMYKAMKVWGLADVGASASTGQNWEQQYDENLINTQNGNGSWPNLGGWMYPSTAAAVAILAPEVASLPPVANAGGPYAAINAGQVLSLNGAGSYHQDPSKNIVKWEWDFDNSDGLWWDTKVAPSAGEGASGLSPTVSYGDVGHDQAYTLTLRVTDNTSPTPLTDTDTATVNVTTGNVPPVPVTNGPWAGLPNVDVLFDATASYDPNAGDAIVSYEWDLDGDGIFNEAGDDGVPVTADRKQVKKSFPSPISLPAKLRVTDTHGASATSTDSLNIVSVALVYGEQYETCYRVQINRFEERRGLVVKFKNQGNAQADNVVMTLTGVPSNLVVLNGVATLGTMSAGQEKSSSCNAAARTADIELKADRRIAPTGVWNWRGDFDLNGAHYTVDNLPPLGP